MNLVDMNLGIVISCNFSDLKLSCNSFVDKFSNCVYSVTGCYSCINLDVKRKKCFAGHIIETRYIRKNDDGIILGFCELYNTTYTEYGISLSVCLFCTLSLVKNREIKCDKKYVTSEEILRQ